MTKAQGPLIILQLKREEQSAAILAHQDSKIALSSGVKILRRDFFTIIFLKIKIFQHRFLNQSMF